MKRHIKKILFVSIIFSLLIGQASAEEDGWEPFRKWYNWKVKTDLPQEQRDALDYLEKVGNVGGEIESIWNEGPATMNPKPSPDKAVELIDGYIEELRSLEVPEICRKHYEASLEYYNIARKYEDARKKYDDRDEELCKINVESLQYDGTRFSEYWNILRESGLFDNMEEEMISLDPAYGEELKKQYGFFKEYKKGMVVACPECDKEMIRAKILYQDDKGYEDEIQNQESEFLFYNERFEGCPEYGYRCDTCQWYEEYPGSDDDTIIIRNWTWGWHELAYKKK